MDTARLRGNASFYGIRSCLCVRVRESTRVRERERERVRNTSSLRDIVSAHGVRESG